MKKLIIVMTVVIAGCTNQVKTDQHDNKNSHEREHSTQAIQLDNGRKWKADEATKRNVGIIVNEVNAGAYRDTAQRKELIANLKIKIDTLVGQCSMKGPEHDALHGWLEKVLRDMNKLNEGSDEYIKEYETLKKDVESFYDFFE